MKKLESTGWLAAAGAQEYNFSFFDLDPYVISSPSLCFQQMVAYIVSNSVIPTKKRDIKLHQKELSLKTHPHSITSLTSKSPLWVIV